LYNAVPNILTVFGAVYLDCVTVISIPRVIHMVSQTKAANKLIHIYSVSLLMVEV